MSHKRQVWETVSEFLSRQESLSKDELADLEKQISKLGREQYKANALTAAQAERLEAALDALREAVARQEAALQEAAQLARMELIEALLPVLDGLEAGLRSGGRYAYRLYRRGSPVAATLMAWLDGQHLLRDRLLAILTAEGVHPIPTMGQMFDPYRHVAVGIVTDDARPDGQIVAEEQRGYAHGDRILRYAEVVVIRNKKDGK